MEHVLDGLLDTFRRSAVSLPDSRRGSNTRYALSDAAACALSAFFLGIIYKRPEIPAEIAHRQGSDVTL